MADSTLVALKGIVSRLRGFSALTTLTTPSSDPRSEKGIYSSVPQQTAFPYILIELESTPWAQQDDSNLEHKVTINAFSNKSSPATVMQIIQEVYNALDRQESNISIDSGSVVLCTFDGVKTTFKDANENIWHGIIEFKFLID